MKRIIFFAILTLAVAAVTTHAAPKKANRGHCVSDCVQAFNKSDKDKGDDADKLLSFAQKECASWCKEEYVSGDGYFWDDGVCNEKYEDTDPDCVTIEVPTEKKSFMSYCASDVDCQSDNCRLYWGYMVCWTPKL